MDRVKVCFLFKVFIRIIEKDPKNLNLLNLFEREHTENPLQVVNITELDENYHEIFDLNMKHHNEL